VSQVVGRVPSVHVLAQPSPHPHEILHLHDSVPGVLWVKTVYISDPTVEEYLVATFVGLVMCSDVISI
jgi:hypothetical protein